MAQRLSLQSAIVSRQYWIWAWEILQPLALWATHHYWPIPRRMKLWKSIFEMSQHASLHSWNVYYLVIQFPGAEPLRPAFQGNEAEPKLCHSRWLPRCLEIKARGQGLGQQVYVIPGTRWGGAGSRARAPQQAAGLVQNRCGPQVGSKRCLNMILRSRVGPFVGVTP